MMRLIRWWIDTWKKTYQNPEMEGWLIHTIHSSWY